MSQQDDENGEWFRYFDPNIDPALWDIPPGGDNIQSQDNEEAINPALTQQLVTQDWPGWHVGEVARTTTPTPQDEYQIYPRTQSEPFNQTSSSPAHHQASVHPTSHTDMAGPEFFENHSMGIWEGALPSTVDPMVNFPRQENLHLLVNPTLRRYIRSERATPQARSPSIASDSPPSSEGPLTHDHPEIRKIMKMVDDKPQLLNLIWHILDCNWYKTRGPEQMPEGELLKAFPKRASTSSGKSPFSAFISAKTPYTCLLCPEGSLGRSLERALGHARDHFNFRPIHTNEKAYTNENTKNDQERRAQNPTRVCQVCHIPVSTQNFSRHVKKSEAHRALVASQATANGTQ